MNRAALIHGKQRAAQNGHDAIEKAADRLLTGSTTSAAGNGSAHPTRRKAAPVAPGA